ncbi:MAG: hypothetical protein DI535_22710 [Citrobacter freundii]|nr:MAG: hypothetical protein DI535_22710 [Citrobacter freundii]
MRTLYTLLFISLCHVVDCFAQHDPLNTWSVGGYSRKPPDVLSSVNNVSSIAGIRQMEIALGGLKRYGLPELDLY